MSKGNGSMDTGMSGFAQYKNVSTPMDGGKTGPNTEYGMGQSVDRNVDPGNEGKAGKRAYGTSANPKGI